MAKKPSRGGLIKQFKSAYIKQLEGRLEAALSENKAIKEDPESVVGRFREELNAVVLQNNQLSAIACKGISKAGGSLTLDDSDFSAFAGKRITIKCERTGEEGKDRVFMFTFSINPVGTKEPDSAEPIETETSEPKENIDADQEDCDDAA